MIVSVGEVVWDIFPEKIVLGGAPVNVAYHLCCLNLDVSVITRIGVDSLGDKTIRQLNSLGLSTEGVQRDNALLTGQVTVTIDQNNEPNFDIVAPAAWDNIDFDQAFQTVGVEPFHMVFGTLAQRDERSRRTIRALWEKAVTCFYDVNLRPPFTTRELVTDSLAVADVVKMNGDELSVIAGWAGIVGKDKKETARELIRKNNITTLVVTEGKEGAWLVTANAFFAHKGDSVVVEDTVGAGDAFFAAIIEGYLSGRHWEETLALANRRGGYVASQKGATPPMPKVF